MSQPCRTINSHTPILPAGSRTGRSRYGLAGRRLLYAGLSAATLLVMGGCKDTYEPGLRPADQTILVVEGHLVQGDTTTISLSRAVELTDTVVFNPELRARLTVEGKDNSSVALTDWGLGRYRALLPHLQTGRDYRLRIRTATGKEYLSDYVTVKTNPPIDSLSWREVTGGVGIYASTHNPANDSRYYRWEWDETWEIRSNFRSAWKKGSPTTVVPRKLPQEDISVCWKTQASTSIVLGSSAKLAGDIISEHPLLIIPPAHEKLAFRYSILVRQYTLSKEAYEYLDLMRKNSETLGSIFDPQPSDIKGNIHSVSDPGEMVIGFLTASAVQQKRMFIARMQIPHWEWYQFCVTSVVANNPQDIEMYLGPDHQPYAAAYHPNNPGIIVGWYASDDECVDCTSRGGTTKKPSFW
ncbi:MAG TPA: DUF4249 domain-containing protein [Chitinophagaceae bacterium]